MSNIFSQKNGSRTWEFTIVGIVRRRKPQTSTPTSWCSSTRISTRRAPSARTRSAGWCCRPLRRRATRGSTKAIDAMFANSPGETATDTEKAFNKAFAAQLGNIALIVVLVVGAAFVTILMIVGNTMALTIRERTREIGVLKTLGLLRRPHARPGARRIGAARPARRVARAGARLAASPRAARPAWSNFMPGFAVTPGIAFRGLALMLALGLVTGIIPALNAMRLEDSHRARARLTTRHSDRFAAPPDRRRHDHQPEEHLAALLAVALDRGGGRAGGDRAAVVPRHGERLPAHPRRLGRGRHRDRAARRLAGRDQLDGLARAGAADRGSPRHRPRRRRQAAGVVGALSRRRRHQALEPDQGQPAAARHRRAGRGAAQGHQDRRAACSIAAATRSWSARG